ncbi:unnamed protein product [Nippostrongylus brasiliensis]|uniref:Putative sodium-coupled neutral amino acid transporter 9 (inferred by orthology to a human protein) n=1 Tax=Nippostrongylus brasiliensis TaxID=27835 RepID=A0A0N4YNJ1_NIPBR|nr:unnamed protein product [Nippostrongylus brasiliensis]
MLITIMMLFFEFLPILVAMDRFRDYSSISASLAFFQNLLNNFRADYVLSAVARVVIFFQLVTILPLIMYFIRSQLFCAIFNDPWPGFFGSFSGMMYMFTLPNLVQMRNLYLKNRLSPCKFVLHTLIIVFGVVNLISQFIVN